MTRDNVCDGCPEWPFGCADCVGEDRGESERDALAIADDDARRDDYEEGEE